MQWYSIINNIIHLTIGISLSPNSVTSARPPEAKASAKEVFINHEQKLEDRRRSVNSLYILLTLSFTHYYYLTIKSLCPTIITSLSPLLPHYHYYYLTITIITSLSMKASTLWKEFLNIGKSVSGPKHTSHSCFLVNSLCSPAWARVVWITF